MNVCMDVLETLSKFTVKNIGSMFTSDICSNVEISHTIGQCLASLKGKEP